MNLKSNLYYDQTANPARRGPLRPRASAPHAPPRARRATRVKTRARAAQRRAGRDHGRDHGRDATADGDARHPPRRGAEDDICGPGVRVIGPRRRASGSAPGLRYPLRIIHHGQARPSVAIVHRSSATTGRDSYILKTLDGLHRLARQKSMSDRSRSAVDTPVSVTCVSVYAWLSMTYELTAVRGPCLGVGRCMYGRCAVYGGCGPRHRRCGPILLRGGPGSARGAWRGRNARAAVPTRVSRARRAGQGGASRARLFRARTRPPRARSAARRAARPPLMCYIRSIT